MSRILLTGATGTVGSAIARLLLAEGREVRALVRSASRARSMLPQAIQLAEGDVTDAASIRKAMEDCPVVYHASGVSEQWLPDPSLFERVNVEGTRNLVEAALEQQVENFLYTSTIDVFTLSAGGEFDESQIAPEPQATPYERSKQEADRIVAAALDRGLPARFLHPSGVYGPTPVTAAGVNDLLARLSRGEIPMLLPGGMPVVFNEDVARGHLLAEERASVGARFILSESFQTLLEAANAVAAARPGTRVPPVLPRWVAGMVSGVGELISRFTARPPLIPSGQLHFLSVEARPSASKARRELGWTPVSFEVGLRRTLAAMQERGELG